MEETKTNLLIASFLLLAFFVLPDSTRAAASDIVFTEIMYSPSGSDAKTEWLEIYNKGNDPVTIVDGASANSWRFNDGSNHTLALFQGSLTIPAGGFAILTSDAQTFLDNYPGFAGTVIDTVMSLNNTFDIIKLSADKGETFFAEVAYQGSWGADGDGKALEKINLSAEDEQSNWRPSAAAGGSPGAGANTAPGSSDGNPEDTPPSSPNQNEPAPDMAPNEAADPSKIKITEVFPNPSGDESSLEFIEIWNNQNLTIALENWKLADQNKITVLPGISLAPGEYRALYRSTTKISLNNSNETIKLFDSAGNLVDELTYSQTIEDQSWGYDIRQNKFFWSILATPNQANEIVIPNDPPVPKIILSNNPVAPHEPVTISATESFDPDNDPLSFFWTIATVNPKPLCDFCGDTIFQASGPIFHYQFPSLEPYTVSLRVFDERHQVATTTIVDVLPAQDIVYQRSLSKTGSEAPVPSSNGINKDNPLLSEEGQGVVSGQMFITEIFPNPIGLDDNEWLEIFNPNDFVINLDGWIIDDQEGGSRPHAIADRNIAPSSYLILGKDETKIILNNTTDEVRLFDAAETLIDSVLYDDAVENQSFTKTDDGSWFWTLNVTPGESNQNSPDRAAVIPRSPAARDEGGLNLYSSDQPIDIDLDNIRELELGTQVRVQGQVAVPPRVLGKTYFYIVGSGGIQVYFSRQDWPNLELGDTVGVIGEVSEAAGEKRIKLADKHDLIFLYKSSIPEPTEINTGDIGEEQEGSLVKITAQLLEKKGASWYLDDGSGEIRAVFQSAAKIEKPAVKAGDWLEITGLVSQTQSGYRLLPRYTSDFGLANTDEAEPRVLGEQIAAGGSQRFRIPANEKPRQIFIYLLITSIALIIVLIGLFIKLRLKTKKALQELKNNKRPESMK